MTQKALKREKTRTLMNDVKDCCEQFGIPEPGVFLMHLAAGLDPRGRSILIQMGQRLAKEYDGVLPPLDVWDNLCETFRSIPPFEGVPLKTSAQALKTLMPFLHAKKSEIEFEGTIAVPPVNADRRDIVEVAKALGKEL